MKIPSQITAAQGCSAELHSAVSQICNLRSRWLAKANWNIRRAAECNSAIQQIKNLRYDAWRDVAFASRQALLHFQSSGAAHRRAFTGLLTT
jgi:hypothetical protein